METNLVNYFKFQIEANKKQYSDNSLNYFYHEGFEYFFKLMISLFLASINNLRKIPPGLTKKYYSAYTNPTLGGLKEFLFWISSLECHPSLDNLTKYIQTIEKKEKGWISKLITLRNKEIHQGQNSADRELANSIFLSISLPDDIGEFVLNDNEILFWKNGEDQLELAPFISFEANYFNTVRSLTPPLTFYFYQNNEGNSRLLLDIWGTLRQKDDLLYLPTTTEIKFRADSSLLGKDEILFEWGADIRKNKDKIYFIKSEFKSSIVSFLKNHLQEGINLSVEINPEDSMLLKISEALKIDIIESPETIITLCGSKEINLVIDLTRINSYQFLDISRWLNEFILIIKDGYRIFIIREINELAKDDEKIFDRISESFFDRINFPPHCKDRGLSSALWCEKKYKKVFGLF